jgi:hypothetical protein
MTCGAQTKVAFRGASRKWERRPQGTKELAGQCWCPHNKRRAASPRLEDLGMGDPFQEGLDSGETGYFKAWQHCQELFSGLIVKETHHLERVPWSYDIPVPAKPPLCAPGTRALPLCHESVGLWMRAHTFMLVLLASLGV